MTWPTDDDPPPEPGALVRRPMVPGDVERLGAGAERKVTVPPATLRTHLLRVLREAGFELKNEQFSLLEASRGSRLGGLTLSRSKVPLAFRADLDPDGTGSRLVVRLADRWPG